MKKIIVFIALLFLAGFNSYAGSADIPIIPSENGEFVYSCNKESSSQVFIIALSHRDTLTRANGENTVKSQVEVYRISEWLIQKEGVELLLPEGFSSKEASSEKENTDSENGTSAALDAQTLEEKLSLESFYVNAEMLLMESFNVKSTQIEDLKLYNEAIEKIKLLEKYGDDDIELLFVKADLNYLQERRVATMLQNIPEVIESEYRAGRIKNKKAIFTIGLSHISAVIKYLKQGRIEIASPVFSPYDDYSSGVKLLENDFGVTIIIPKTLIKLQTGG